MAIMYVGFPQQKDKYEISVPDLPRILNII